MRQIKFRGYNSKRGIWLNGSYILNRGHHFIAPDEFAEGKTWEDYEVEEDSIGQFTGVCDCDGILGRVTDIDDELNEVTLGGGWTVYCDEDLTIRKADWRDVTRITKGGES